MSGIVFNEGLVRQADQIFDVSTPHPFTLAFAVNDDTVPFDGTETYSSESAWLGGRGPFAYGSTFPSSILESGGVCTIALNTQDVFVTAGSTTVTITQWMLYDSSDSVLLWGGPIMPPFTLSSSGPISCFIEGITITLGECPGPPPLPFLLDTFAGSVTPLGSHSMDTGPGWSPILGSASAGGGSASFAASSPQSVAFTSGSDTYGTASLVFSWNGLAQAFAGCVFAGVDTTTYTVGYWFNGIFTGQSTGFGSYTGSSLNYLGAMSPAPALAAGSHTITVNYSSHGATLELDGLLQFAIPPSVITSGKLFGLAFDPQFGNTPVSATYTHFEVDA